MLVIFEATANLKSNVNVQLMLMLMVKGEVYDIGLKRTRFMAFFDLQMRELPPHINTKDHPMHINGC